VLKEPKTETTEGHGGERGVERADEILVEPLCLFDLKTYSGHRREICFWQIDDKSYTEVIEPYPKSCQLDNLSMSRRGFKQLQS
jgi:hypothetical protein